MSKESFDALAARVRQNSIVLTAPECAKCSSRDVMPGSEMCVTCHEKECPFPIAADGECAMFCH